MLIQFRFKNFRSFREEAILSMVAGKDQTLLDNTIPAPALGKDVRLLKSVAIYGANAAGKSNVIKAAKFVKSFVAESVQEIPGGELGGLKPFLLENASATSPSEFEVSFLLDQVRYQYGFALDQRKVHREWLYAFPKGKVQRWYVRSWDKEKPQWQFSTHLKGEKSRLAELTRPNALFLSVATKFNHQQLSSIFNWFTKYFEVIDLAASGSATLRSEEDTTAYLCYKKKEIQRYISAFLKCADLGISGLAIEKGEFVDAFESTGSPQERADKMVAASESDLFKVAAIHKARDSGKPVLINMAEESSGTQRLFMLSGQWILMLSGGQMLFVDELHASMHPAMTRSLLELLHNPKLNKKGAQLIFTSHDSTLLDPTLLRRDQIWLVEKDQEGGSHLYSLQEFSPRKDEALQKGYLAGRYGAVPCLGEFKF